METFDALIIGSGVAGATTAQLLQRNGWSVAIVEKAQYPRNKVCGEYLSSTNMDLLDEIGILDDFSRRAGPSITRVGLFDRSTVVTASMPKARDSKLPWGRALRREILDPLLLHRAVEMGARVYQPAAVVNVSRDNDGFTSSVAGRNQEQPEKIKSKVVIAAHGSWELGPLPTQREQHPQTAGDLFGFKAHFAGSILPEGLMPMIVFPGGYGGMVNCGDGLTSLSYCIRRDTLESARKRFAGQRAGEAAFAHIIEHCVGVRETLENATVHGSWMSAGPIRPGIRPRYLDGFYSIGNAAGEAHPIIAEGISIAMQSAWLLSQSLTKIRPRDLTRALMDDAGAEYSAEWLNAFRLRIRASEMFANLAMSRQVTHSLLLPVMMAFPRILTAGARLSGKVNRVVNLTPVPANL